MSLLEDLISYLVVMRGSLGVRTTKIIIDSQLAAFMHGQEVSHIWHI
jgi:hypothetical protein